MANISRILGNRHELIPSLELAETGAAFDILNGRVREINGRPVCIFEIQLVETGELRTLMLAADPDREAVVDFLRESEEKIVNVKIELVGKRDYRRFADAD